MTTKPATVCLGPYYQRNAAGRESWRIVVKHADGTRTASVYATENEALAAKADAQIASMAAPPKTMTIREAVELYGRRKITAGQWAPRTIDRTMRDLREFAEPHDAPLAALTPDFLRAYIVRTAWRSLYSRRNRFSSVASFCLCAWQSGIIAENPAAKLRNDEKPWFGPRAQRLMHLGKAQLQSDDEITRYLTACRAHPFAAERVSAALPMMCNLRSAEVLNLRVRDADWQAGEIWIRGPHIKSKRSERICVGLPEWICADLKRMCAGRDGAEWLMPSVQDDSKPRRGDRLWELVHRTCTAAGVRVVCVHGLRGAYSTAGVKSGRSVPAVSVFLGHADTDTSATLRNHYLQTPERTPTIVEPSASRKPVSRVPVSA